MRKYLDREYNNDVTRASQITGKGYVCSLAWEAKDTFKFHITVALRGESKGHYIVKIFILRNLNRVAAIEQNMFDGDR